MRSSLIKARCAYIELSVLCMFLWSCNVHTSPPVVHVPPPVSVTKAPSEADSELSPGQIRLPHGTSLWLMTIESVSSKTAKAGDRVRLQVVGGVTVGDLVVIANKAPAFGTITEVKKPGLAWHPGNITMRLESVTLANGQEVPLEPSPVTEFGEANQPTQDDFRDAMQFTGGLYLVYFPFSFLEHGEQAVQPRGTVVQATIQGNTVLERASIESSQPATPKRDEAPASLTIYYPEFAPNGSLTVWCGAARVGKVRHGHRLNVRLRPGSYWVRSKKEEVGIFFNAELGGDDYMEILSPKNGIEYVDHDLGEARAAFTLPADPKDIRDITKISLSDLQAKVN